MNWFESFSVWFRGFLSDSKTNKASLTALMKLGVMIVLWAPYIKLSIGGNAFPIIPDWQAWLTILIIFEKFSGRLIDGFLLARFGIKPQEKTEDAKV